MRIRGIYIGEIVATTDRQYVDGMKAPEEIKNSFMGDDVTLAIMHVLNKELPS